MGGAGVKPGKARRGEPPPPFTLHRSYRSQLLSSDGDAFTLLRVFEEWLKVKATGQAPSLPDQNRLQDPQQHQHQQRQGGGRDERGRQQGQPGGSSGGGRTFINSTKWCR